MKFVLLIYQGATPLPGSERWNALSQPEQKAIYADYAELNRRHVAINRAHCLANPNNFKGYGPLCWGLTAGDDLRQPLGGHGQPDAPGRGDVGRNDARVALAR